MGRWINQPSEFRKPEIGETGFIYPVLVQEEHGDGTFTGIIDEDKLTTVQRSLLSFYEQIRIKEVKHYHLCFTSLLNRV